MVITQCRYCGKPGRIAHGVQFSSCEACSTAIKQGRTKAAMKGVATRRARMPHVPRPDGADPLWQRMAHAFVDRAKRSGLLPSLEGDIACTDCGCVATIYEHRDYSRPLDVEPVCGSCNANRGTAIWPSADRYKFKRIS